MEILKISGGSHHTNEGLERENMSLYVIVRQRVLLHTHRTPISGRSGQPRSQGFFSSSSLLSERDKNVLRTKLLNDITNITGFYPQGRFVS